MNKDAAPVRVPQQKRSLKTKKKILKAAERLFSEKGFHKTNSKEISAKAGVSIGSFYAYFKDKKMVFLEVLKDHCGEVTRRLTSQEILGVSKSQDLRSFIATIARNVLEAHSISPGLHREISIMCFFDSDVEKQKNMEEQAIYENALELLKMWRDRIRVKDLPTAAYLICNVFEQNIHALRFSHSTIDEERLLEELVDMICRYLLPNPDQT